MSVENEKESELAVVDRVESGCGFGETVHLHVGDTGRSLTNAGIGRLPTIGVQDPRSGGRNEVNEALTRPLTIRSADVGG